MNLRDAVEIVYGAIPARYGMYHESEYDEYCKDSMELSQAQEFLKKYADKYRWKNPEDLPDTDRDVEIIVNAQFSDKPFHLIARSADKEGYIWEISGQVFYETLDTSTICVIAWREIEPFEVDE